MSPTDPNNLANTKSSTPCPREDCQYKERQLKIAEQIDFHQQELIENCRTQHHDPQDSISGRDQTHTEQLALIERYKALTQSLREVVRELQAQVHRANERLAFLGVSDGR